ncbi:oligosaccharide flippase family protein [Geodermatophilus sp. SYSU D01119]
MSTTSPADGELGRLVRTGLVWSLANSATLRLGTFLSSILFARILDPEAFGVFAVALTAQTVLINLAEFGLTSYLVKHGRLREQGPTVTTVATVSGGLVVGLMCVTAPWLSAFMGAPQATATVQVMSVVVLLGGVGAVPSAKLQREFAQRRQFAVDATNFAVSTVVTLVLALAGLGVWALAIGRVTAQVSSTVLLFVLAGERLRFGWDRGTGLRALTFGLPLAAANVLSWVLLTVDNAIVGHWVGVLGLGFYVLAFNVSSWPMSVIGMAARAVALPGFVRAGEEGGRPADGLETAVRATALVALPAGALLAVLAGPLVEFLYGARWLPAAAALPGLALFGALRVVLDIFVSFLIARGATRTVLSIQVLWLVLLTPAMYAAVVSSGLAGAGWVHLLVAVVVTVPAYLLAVRAHGVGAAGLVRAALPGAGVTVVVGAVAWAGAQVSGTAVLSLVAGSFGGVAAWAAVVLPAVLRSRTVRPDPAASARPPEAVTAGAGRAAAVPGRVSPADGD